MESKKEDEDWLSLGNPLDSTKPKESTRTQEDKVKPRRTKPTMAAAVQPEVPARLDPEDPDEFRLAPPGEVPASNASTAKTPAGQSLFDDDLPELLPLAEPISATQSEKVKTSLDLPDIALPDLDLNDIPLAPLENPQPKTTKSKNGKSPNSSDPFEELSLESPALIGSSDSTIDEEFRFPCKLCGSLLCSSRGRVGHPIRCPDCFSELKVPSPPPKKKKAEVHLDAEVAKVTFTPIDSLSVHGTNSSSEKTKEILDRAEQTLESERAEYQGVSGTFDTKRWMGFLFGFLQDPLVIAAAVGLGFVAGLWLFAVAGLGVWVQLDSAQILFAQLSLLVVFGVPILGAICLCGIGILTMAANRANRVVEWPFMKIAESIGECGMVLAAVLAASIPGGMLCAVFRSLNAHPMVSFGWILLGIWATIPILLLGMIDSSSLFQPYSKAVFQSILRRAEAWGAMYMHTGMAFTGFFLMMVLTGTESPVGNFVLGLALPSFCFFLFNQYGVLAGRISDVTGMGFDGDFSAD